MATRALDPIFVQYAKSAPLEDLRAYLRYGANKLAEYELPSRSIELLGQMVTLKRELTGRDGTPADKRRVWDLIERFKSSIPGFAGNAGALGSWTPVDVRTTATLWSFLKVQIDPTGRPLIDASLFARLEQYDRAYRQACEKAETIHQFRVPRHTTRLEPAEVAAMIHATIPEGQEQSQEPGIRKPTVRRSVATVKVSTSTALSCPACSSSLSSAGTRFLCGSCGASWELTRTKAAKASASPKSAVDWRAAGLKAAETRRRRLAEAAAAKAAEGTAA